MHYGISNKGGSFMGVYVGESKEEALLAMFREAGHDEKDVWIGSDGELCFVGPGIKQLLGNVDDWIFDGV